MKNLTTYTKFLEERFGNRPDLPSDSIQKKMAKKYSYDKIKKGSKLVNYRAEGIKPLGVFTIDEVWEDGEITMVKLKGETYEFEIADFEAPFHVLGDIKYTK